MLCPAEMAMLVNILAISITEGKTTQELTTLAVVFTQLADTIATIAVQQANIKECCENQKSKKTQSSTTNTDEEETLLIDPTDV